MKAMILKKLLISVIFLFTLMSCSAQNANLYFYNEDSVTLYNEMIVLTTLDLDNTDNSYQSTTYFTDNGIIELPYSENGYNIILITCAFNMIFYMDFDPFNTFYVPNCEANE
jgi:hypothetical protein